VTPKNLEMFFLKIYLVNEKKISRYINLEIHVVNDGPKATAAASNKVACGI
jgi:hypothetical protein